MSILFFIMSSERKVIDSLDRNNTMKYIFLAEKQIESPNSRNDELVTLTSWFQEPELIIIGARTSMGKTALMLDIASKMASSEGKNVVIFSLKTSKKQLKSRLSNMGITKEDIMSSGLVIDDTE